MNLIMAMDEAQGIGRDRELLTHLPGDMKYLWETIRGKIVVMGRKTLESFPDAKPLKGRVNIVLTQNRDYCPKEVTVRRDVNEALKTLKQYPEEDTFTTGGGMIHGEFLLYCRKAYVTCIHSIFQANTRSMDLDREKDWEWGRVDGMQEYNGPAYEFRIYTGRQQG